MKVLTNMPAILTYNHLKTANSNLDKLSKKLSTGQNFTNAIENPAMMGLTENYDGVLRALNVAVQNAQMGLGYYDAIDQAYQELSEKLKQLKELVIRAANGTYSAEDRQVMSHEISALKLAISNIIQSTVYNGDVLLDGTLQVKLQIGDEGQEVFNIVNSVGLTPATLGIDAVTASAAFSAQNNVISRVNSAIAMLGRRRGIMGHQAQRLQGIIERLQIEIDNYTSVNSSIKDTDIAAEMIKYTSQQVIQQAAQAMLAQGNVRVQNLLALFR